MAPHDFKKFPELTNNQMQIYYFESPHKQLIEGFLAKITKVIDGDTVRLEIEERDFDFPLRIKDIAAPELNEVGGAESQRWLEDLILGEEVYIKLTQNRVEKWGRLLGEIIFGGQSISELSLMVGNSVPFGNGAR